MKKFALLLAAAWVLSTVAAPLLADGKTHEMTMEVMSVNLQTKMISLKDDKGDGHTVVAMGDAIEEMKTVKPGDRVTVTCQDNEKGVHQGVIAIKPVAQVKPAK